MLLGRSFVLSFKVAVSSTSVNGTAGAMEKSAALKVAMRMVFFGLAGSVVVGSG